jgi:transcriptional regulator with XRE-family HTH domain
MHPVHGPEGRVALVRLAMGMRQADLARAVAACGGRAGRETVSHWENIDADGAPRSRLTRQNAAALAAVVRNHLGLDVSAETFFEPRETVWDELKRGQLELRSQMERLHAKLEKIERQLAGLRDAGGPNGSTRGLNG